MTDGDLRSNLLGERDRDWKYYAEYGTTITSFSLVPWKYTVEARNSKAHKPGRPITPESWGTSSLMFNDVNPSP